MTLGTTARRARARALLLLASLALSAAKMVDFERDAGAMADADDFDTLWANGAALNASLNGLSPGDSFVVPNKTFYLMGGIIAKGLRSVTIIIDGTLYFGLKSENLLTDAAALQRYRSEWPRSHGGESVLQCLQFDDANGLALTSNGTGVLEGAGAKWWGVPGVGYLLRVERRPQLIRIERGTSLLVERLYLHNSPYWTFYCVGCVGLEVRHSSIDARRTQKDAHGLIDLTAFNTDGFDVTGRNIWIHDCTVWNQDDCFDVKDGTENVLIENIEASGLGLTIGSISGSTVRNVTFRNARMHRTDKGIYMKFRGAGLVADVTYENIVIEEPTGYAIWVGPAQQSDSRQICAAHPCSLCWPELPGSQCAAPAGAQYVNITLRNISVLSPTRSPGVLLANESSPMRNVVFEDVVVTNPGSRPFGDAFYKCENVQGVATGTTHPVPPCFEDRTERALRRRAMAHAQ